MRGLLSVLPRGWFSFEAASTREPVAMIVEGRDNKRRRDSLGGCSTPTLMPSPSGVMCTIRPERPDNCTDDSPRPAKRSRNDASGKAAAAAAAAGVLSSSTPSLSLSFSSQGHEKRSKRPHHVLHELKSHQDDDDDDDDEPASINSLPEDAVANIISFLGTTDDRSALQNTSKLFRKLSNDDAMLKNVDVSGDPETGKGGIIQEHDTPASATTALTPFANAGNTQAQYMLGIVLCYCYQDLNNGIRLLESAAKSGYVRAKYTLGIILRDALPHKTSNYMQEAADANYFPALQETLSAREMKERFGEPSAEELRRYLDPVGLNRLLLRDYVNSAELRGMNTSHCWNPLCGKWAFKASNSIFPPMRRGNHGSAPIYDVVDEAVMDPPPFDQGLAAPTQQSTAGRRSVLVGMVNSGNTMNGGNNNGNHLGLPQRLHHGNRREVAHHVTDSCNHHNHPSVQNQALAWKCGKTTVDCVSRMKMCSRCCRAKYCSKLCQVYDWRSSQHKMECQFL